MLPYGHARVIHVQIFLFRSLTLNEALDILEDEDELCDVYMEPPDVRELTDEDSASEEDEQPERLCGNQLLAAAEIRRRRVADVSNKSKSDDDEPPTETARPPSKKAKKIPQEPLKWKIGEKIMCGLPLFPEPDYSKYRDFSPTELFELFFDQEMFEFIVQQSKLYCAYKNWPDINVTKEEIKVFFGILIVSGYNPMPSKASFWSSSPDLRNEDVCNAMRRDRFDRIMRCLHFNDNTKLDVEDKYTKLRPLIQHLQKRAMDHFIPTQAISHDEAMVKYFGKHGCKQSIRNKPIRFGYKIWCQNTVSGYLVAFEPYQGKSHIGNAEIQAKFGKPAATVLELIGEYSTEKKSLPYSFYFDNYFTTVPLLMELKERGYNGTGTIKSNSVGKDCPLMHSKAMEKKERGYFMSATASDKSKSVVLSRWKDNAVVTVASSLYGSEPIGSVDRWSRVDKKKIKVSIPHGIEMYNKGMGGTDRMDQNINKYRISVKSKKWWWSLFTWMLDMAVHNAWQLSKGQGSALTQLQFRREIAVCYLHQFGILPKGKGRKSTTLPAQDFVRYDNLGHLVEPVQDNKKRRCANTGCTSIGRTQCSRCNVGLCVKCFRVYHTK